MAVYPNPDGPWDPSEIAWALNRPERHRTPIPRPHDRVLCRIEPFAPLADAEVLDVQAWDTYDDHYLWHVLRGPNGEALTDDLGRRMMAPAPDPWPILTLATPWGRLTMREGRVRGSQGWWPPDWRRRFYPAPGGGRLIRPHLEETAA